MNRKVVEADNTPLELAKKFIAQASQEELNALITKHEAYANVGPTYADYLTQTP